MFVNYNRIMYYKMEIRGLLYYCFVFNGSKRLNRFMNRSYKGKEFNFARNSFLPHILKYF